ncbi:hypothetical protein DV737_g5793, partial [Chaetothyriales sp. CBS 132003]
MHMESRYTPTSPLSPKLSGNNRPMSPQPGVQRPGQVRKPSRSLNTPLPRFHPGNFNQSSGAATASPAIPTPGLSLNRGMQPMELDSPKVMREKHQEFLNSVRLSAKVAASPFGQKPGSPRLDPLGSPKGPVTPLGAGLSDSGQVANQGGGGRARNLRGNLGPAKPDLLSYGLWRMTPFLDTMRQPRSSLRTYILALGVFVGLAFLLYSLQTSSPLASVSLRQRKSDAAAANPLSPPTSAFRKTSSLNGAAAPPPVVHYQLNNLTASADPVARSEKVLILTPLARFYDEYWANLLHLSYPHEHISLGFITPKTKEGNAATAALQAAIQKTQSGPEELRFQSVTILRQDFEPPLASQSESARHELKVQKERRAAMARARNSLLFTTIGPATSWVLWLDSDIVETPSTLIQDLASIDKPIVVPNCFQRYKNDKDEDAVRPYDYNSWVDTESARSLLRKLDADEILVEGYAEMPTYRTLMAMLYDPAMRHPKDAWEIMELDGVGGTALMVKAEVHRDGAMFPPFPFYHLIETEGFAKMAKRLGYQSYGLINYLVYHYNE